MHYPLISVTLMGRFTCYYVVTLILKELMLMYKRFAMKHIHILPALLFLSTLACADSPSAEQKQFALVFKGQRDDGAQPLVTMVPLPCTMEGQVSADAEPLIILPFADQADEAAVSKLPVVERPTIEYQDVEMFGHFVRAYKIVVSQACKQSCVVISAPVSSLDVAVVELPQTRKQEMHDDFDSVEIDPEFVPDEMTPTEGFYLSWAYYFFSRLPLCMQKKVIGLFRAKGQ
jgi:hypothetical protein